MSIIIIAFPAAPKATSEAIKAENELNELLKQKVTGQGKRERENRIWGESGPNLILFQTL